MTYRINQESSILYDGNVQLLKAANDVGKLILGEILKEGNFSSISYSVLPLTYVPEKKTWLDTKGRYVIFNIADNSDQGVAAVAKYQNKFDKSTEPSIEAEVVDVSGSALATDGGAVLGDASGGVIDIPKDSDVKREKIENLSNS